MFILYTTSLFVFCSPREALAKYPTALGSASYQLDDIPMFDDRTVSSNPYNLWGPNKAIAKLVSLKYLQQLWLKMLHGTHSHIFLTIAHLVGGLEHDLFSISYMGCHPSH